MAQLLETATPADGIRADFDLLQRDLDAARADQRRKDTPAARARVRLLLDRLDAVLDMWNDARQDPLTGGPQR